MHLVTQTTVSLINKCEFANFVDCLKICLMKALHFKNLFVAIVDCSHIKVAVLSTFALCKNKADVKFPVDLKQIAV